MKRALAVCLAAGALLGLPGSALAQPEPNPNAFKACEAEGKSDGHAKVPFCPGG